MPRASSSERDKNSRKKGRASVACLSCRARKLACDLGSPCSTCLSKNEGSTCSLANQLYYENMDEAPASKLKASVDRLEAMVLKRLSSQSQALHRRNFSGSSRTSSNYGSPRASIYGSPSLSSNTSAPSSPNLLDRPNIVHEAEMISKLLLCDEVSNATGTGIDLNPIVADLRQSSSSFSLPLPLLAEPHSLQNRPTTAEFTSLFQMMPTESQTYRLADYFFLRVDPLFHLVHRPRFELQLKDIWTDGNGGLSCCVPFCLATFLVICGNGLVSMSEEECISAGDLPINRDSQILLARSWIDASLQCLAYGDFINHPSMESIKAIVLLNQFWSSFGGGLHLNASISFNTSVIAAAIELDLARDPDELDYNFSPLEAEERRRVFWALFSIDTLTRALLGKTYAPFDAAIISVRLPCHLPDEAFSSEGNFEYGSTAQPHSNLMTSVITIHALSLVLCRISKALTGPRKSSRNEIVKLNDEIKELEMNYRSSLQQTAALECSSVRGLAQIMIWFAYVKLHRSSLRSGSLDDNDDNDDIAWHRSIYIQHCDNLLDSYQIVDNFGPAAEFLASTMICSAAITVAIDLQQSPSDSTTTETPTRLFSLIKSIESNAWSGGIYRRAAIILRHLDVLVFVENPEVHKYAPIQDDWSIDIQMIQTECPPFSFPAQPFIHGRFASNSYDDPSLAISPLPTPVDPFPSYSRTFEILPNDFQNEQGLKLDIFDGPNQLKLSETLMDPWIANSNPSQVEWHNFSQQSSPILALLN